MMSPGREPGLLGRGLGHALPVLEGLTSTLFVATPNASTLIRARTNAMRKCMAEPAEPTTIRFQKAC